MKFVKKAVVTVVTAGMLAACGGAGERDSPAKSGSLPTAEKSPPLSVKAPKGFDTSKGWQQTVRWPDDGDTKPPVGTAPEAGIVAFLQKKGEHYVVEAREADTGALRWSSRPWQPPALGKDVASDPRYLPQLLVVNDNGREYVVVWAYAASFTEDDTVSLVLYPADSSGKEISPAHTFSVPMNAQGDPLVADGGNGVMVRWEDSRPGDVRTAAIDLTKDRVTVYDDEMELPCDDDIPCLGSVEALSPNGPVVQLGAHGGFGAPGAWHAGDAVPPGAKTNPGKYNSGRIMEVLGGHVLSTWFPESGPGNLSVTAAHDLKSGRLVASVPCKGGEETAPARALSPDGRYAVWDTVALDFQQGKAYCFDGDSEDEFVHLVSVADGTAYGYTRPGGKTVSVAVTLDTGQVETLPAGTEIPSLLLPKAGGFTLELPDGGGQQFIFHPRR
ncbi:hypothetical protein [Streptomyces sp. NPDC018947]|uniref:hypothetical protein n=1 Tax=Streptomyces sp. NPDC018947 TaxID=3365054 RepID=UPI0037957E91